MMRNRIALLLCLFGMGIAATLPQEEPKSTITGSGWTEPIWLFDDPRALADIPNSWKESGEGKTRLLYQDYEKVHGVAYDPRDQGAAPSCVGQATAAACDFLAAVQVAEGKRERAPPAGAAAETIYGWSRINIGEIDAMRFGGGSHVRWAAAAIQRYGVVPMVDVAGYNLSVPSPQRCVEYGFNGVPEELVPVGQRHIVVEYIKVTTYEQVRDAVKNGCPIIIGSNIGFGNKGTAQRDADGFLNRPRGWFGFGTSRWNHAMCIIGMCDEGRQGGLILNSWGPDWIDGPKRFGDEPEGSFWASKDDINDIVSQGDSYAIRMFVGYPSYQLWR